MRGRCTAAPGTGAARAADNFAVGSPADCRRNSAAVAGAPVVDIGTAPAGNFAVAVAAAFVVAAAAAGNCNSVAVAAEPPYWGRSFAK